MSEKKDWSVLKTGAVILGVAFAGYLVNEMRKEYDKNVNDYNELLDFIDKHDFYEKQESKPVAKTPKDKNAGFNPNLSKVDEYVNNVGQTVNVYKDSDTGFKVYKYEGKREENKRA